MVNTNTKKSNSLLHAKIVRNIMNVFKYITSPWRIPLALQNHGLEWLVSDEMYIRCMYKEKFGRFPNLKNPQTFNEKLQWLKLNSRKSIYTNMVDKYEVKKYVANIIGEEFIVPTLGVWDKFDDIDFDILPNQFVLKCTHDSGSIIICKDKSKLDIQKAKAKIEKSLSTNYYLLGREWPYKNVRRRIIAEPYLEDSSTLELRDYKFYCFDGEIKCYAIHFDRSTEHHANYYDLDGNLLNEGLMCAPPIYEKNLEQPKEISQMIFLAHILSLENPFLRVDFYDVNGHVYFGELTFYPASGFVKFTSEQFDLELGQWLILPNSRK